MGAVALREPRAERQCDLGPCPVHCTVSQWSSWGDCSVKKCGGGTAVRTRTVAQTDSAGGIQCPNLADVRNCNEQKCPIDCDLAAWGKEIRQLEKELKEGQTDEDVANAKHDKELTQIGRASCRERV